MKILSRDFTVKEKVLLVILLLVLIALGYYQFVFKTTRDAMERANSERDMYQTELNIALVKEAQIRSMKEELDSIGELSASSRMASYNNAKAEISLLNSVLEAASDYSVTFASVTKDGDQIRRNFSLSFTTGDFATARRIITRLAESEYRCLIGDLSYNASVRRAAKDEPTVGGYWVDDVYYFNVISVNATATFFETMYGGTPDQGLPQDSAKK